MFRATLIAVLAVVPAHASLTATQTFYVSPNGSDTNAGTDATAPLKTIARALSLWSAGDTIALQSGGKWAECVTYSGNLQTITAYGTGAKPVIGSGCQQAVFSKGFNGITLKGVHVSGTVAEGFLAIGGVNGTIDGVDVDNTGMSSYLIKPAAATTGDPLTGWQIKNSSAGLITKAPGLNYDLAGFELRGLSGALLQNDQASTHNQMGFQDRIFGNVVGGKNTLTKSRAIDNEGEVTWVEPAGVVSYSHMWNGRGFGLQQGDDGNAFSNVIENLGPSTDGRIYNGVDDNGATNATLSNNTIRNVAGCSITAEGDGKGIKVNGGSVDATKGGLCALYVTASAMPVTFDGKTTWTTTGKAFKMGSLAYANMMTQDQFVSSIGGTK